MKCLKLYGKHDLRYEETPDIVIGEDGVLIKTKSVTICRSDIHYYSFGEIGSIGIEKPIIPGHEFSGEVSKIGKNIHNFKVGDRVAVDPSVSCGVCEFCLRGDNNLCPDVKFCGTPPVMGALSEYYAASEKQLFRLPDNFSFEDGALLEPLGVALHAARLAKMKDGQKVAVLGLGPIGLLVVQLASITKKISVHGFDCREERIHFSKRYNLDSVLKIDCFDLKNKAEFQSDLSKFDIVFEAAGSNDAVNLAMQLTKPGGKVILIGIPPEENITINSTLYRRKGLRLIGVRRMKDTYPEAISMINSGKINFDGIITHRFPPSMGAFAFDLVERYGDGVIKAAINF